MSKTAKMIKKTLSHIVVTLLLYSFRLQKLLILSKCGITSFIHWQLSQSSVHLTTLIVSEIRKPTKVKFICSSVSYQTAIWFKIYKMYELQNTSSKRLTLQRRNFQCRFASLIISDHFKFLCSFIAAQVWHKFTPKALTSSEIMIFRGWDWCKTERDHAIFTSNILSSHS